MTTRIQHTTGDCASAWLYGFVLSSLINLLISLAPKNGTAHYDLLIWMQHSVFGTGYIHHAGCGRAFAPLTNESAEQQGQNKISFKEPNGIEQHRKYKLLFSSNPAWIHTCEGVSSLILSLSLHHRPFQRNIKRIIWENGAEFQMSANHS